MLHYHPEDKGLTLNALRDLTRMIAGAALDAKAEALRLSQKYDPHQARVPAGNNDGGQWTSDGMGGGTGYDRIGKPAQRAGARTGVSSGDRGSDGMPTRSSMDTARANTYLKENISKNKYGDGNCARNVRQAIEAAGIKIRTEDLPAQDPKLGYRSAKDYGEMLDKIGFEPVSVAFPGDGYPSNNYQPVIADVVII